MSWKTFGDNVKSATGVSIVTIAILFATYGKQFVEAASALPTLYKAYAAVLPNGLWSALMGVCLSAGFHAIARSWHRKSLAIDVTAVIVGAAVVMIQMNNPTSASLLSALLVGINAGLAGLLISKIARSIFTGKFNDPRPDPSVPESD